jgi:hypothetical protein
MRNGNRRIALGQISCNRLRLDLRAVLRLSRRRAPPKIVRGPGRTNKSEHGVHISIPVVFSLTPVNDSLRSGRPRMPETSFASL